MDFDFLVNPLNARVQSTEFTGINGKMPEPTMVDCTHTHNFLRLYGLCPGQAGWAGTKRNIDPLTPIVVINRSLSASSINYDWWYPACSIHIPDNLFPQSLSKFSLIYLLSWYLPLHTPHIPSSNHCLLFATYAYTIATYFAVVLRLCHLVLVSLLTLDLEDITWLSYIIVHYLLPFSTNHKVGFIHFHCDACIVDEVLPLIKPFN